jgi:hypothetical protein
MRSPFSQLVILSEAKDLCTSSPPPQNRAPAKIL